MLSASARLRSLSAQRKARRAAARSLRPTGAAAVSNGQILSQGDADKAIAAASAESGFTVLGLRTRDYELLSVNVSRPPDAAAGDGPRYVLLKYRRLAPGGNGALVHMVEHPFHRDAPISGGREEEPPATPVATTVKGLAIVRVEMPAGVGFTARIGDRTVDVVFMNPGPPEPEMLRLVEGIFQ